MSRKSRTGGVINSWAGFTLSALIKDKWVCEMYFPGAVLREYPHIINLAAGSHNFITERKQKETSMNNKGTLQHPLKSTEIFPVTSKGIGLDPEGSC